MTELSLEFIAQQLEHAITELASQRDEMRELRAIVMHFAPQDGMKIKPGTELTVETAKIGMQVRVRALGTRKPSVEVYTIMPKAKDDPLFNDPEYVAYSEEYITHVRELVAA